MKISSRNYPLVVGSGAFLALLLVNLFDYLILGRSFFDPFFITSLLFTAVSLIFVIWLYFNPFSDVIGALMILHHMLLGSIMGWTHSFYEYGFVVIAVTAAFFRFERSWIYPAFTFFGFLLYLTTFYMQHKVSWTPEPSMMHERALGFTVLIIFAWCVHYFSVYRVQKEHEQLLRLGIVGYEANRIIHDLKGMLSTPMLMIESLKGADRTPENDRWFEEQLKLLIRDMEHIRNVMKGINSLAIQKSELEAFDAIDSIKKAMMILDHRLRGVEVSLSIESRLVIGRRDLLNSAFFNLFLNSLEAIEGNKVSKPIIKIYCQDEKLIYEDNAGGIFMEHEGLPRKTAGSGIGLKIIAEDLSSMNIDFRIKTFDDGTRFELIFPS